MAQNYYISVKHCNSSKIHTSTARIYMFHFFKYLKCSHLFFDNKLNLVHFRQFQLLFLGRLYFSTINTLNVFHWVQVKQHSWQVIILFFPFFPTLFFFIVNSGVVLALCFWMVIMLEHSSSAKSFCQPDLWYIHRHSWCNVEMPSQKHLLSLWVSVWSHSHLCAYQGYEFTAVVLGQIYVKHVLPHLRLRNSSQSDLTKAEILNIYQALIFN